MWVEVQDISMVRSASKSFGGLMVVSRLREGGVGGERRLNHAFDGEQPWGSMEARRIAQSIYG